MTTYIAIDDILNITNKEESDVFSFMAGGIFDYTYAGSSGYNAGFTPAPNLTAFFINQAMDMALSMLDLNENFVEFALLPMQILIYKEYQRDINKEIQNIANDTSEIIKGLHESTDGRYGFKIKESDTDGEFGKGLGAGEISGEFLNELREQRQKSFFKDWAMQWGFKKAGPIGAIMAGWAYEGKVSGALMADVVTSTLANEFKNLAVQSLSKALGITSPVATFGLSWGLSELFGELAEMALGLDNSFGFGGEFIGVSPDGIKGYTAPLGLWDGLKNMLGLLDKQEIVSDEINFRMRIKKGDVIGMLEQGKVSYYNFSTFDNRTQEQRARSGMYGGWLDNNLAAGFSNFLSGQYSYGQYQSMQMNFLGQYMADVQRHISMSLTQESKKRAEFSYSSGLQRDLARVEQSWSNFYKGQKNKLQTMSPKEYRAIEARRRAEKAKQAGGAAADAAAGKNLGWSTRDKTKDRKGGLYGGGSIGSRTGGAHSRGGAAAGAAAGGAASAGRNAAGKK